MSGSSLDRAAVRRILISLVIAETQLTRWTTNMAPAGQSGEWSDDRALSVGGIDLDSLETVHAAAAVNEMFDLDGQQQVGSQIPMTIGDWLDLIIDKQSRGQSTLTVMTSGSTGRPKACRHSIADLCYEVARYRELLPAVRRVISLVPAHHIYGLIWTALLPAAFGIPVIDASTIAMPQLAEDDLVVGVPEQWGALGRSRRTWPSRVTGVSAAGQLDKEVSSDLLGSGLERLYDVYGSSETGGVAIREAQDPTYALLPRWRFATPLNESAPILVDRDGRETPLPDRIALGSNQRFLLAGRRDDAVQVGGVNVWPRHVAEVLKRCPGVQDVAVRLGAQGRLKAFIVPTARESVASELRQVHASRLLEAAQRPTSYTFGDELPLTALGKASDWS